MIPIPEVKNTLHYLFVSLCAFEVCIWTAFLIFCVIIFLLENVTLIWKLELHFIQYLRQFKCLSLSDTPRCLVSSKSLGENFFTILKVGGRGPLDERPPARISILIQISNQSYLVIFVKEANHIRLLMNSVDNRTPCKRWDFRSSKLISWSLKSKGIISWYTTPSGKNVTFWPPIVAENLALAANMTKSRCHFKSVIT